MPTGREHAAAEALWQPLYFATWEEAEPVDGVQNLCSTYRAAFASLATDFGLGSAYCNAYLRAKRALRSIAGWASTHVPAMAASLAPPASDSAVEEATADLDLGTWCPAARVLFRVHNGQRLRFDTALAERKAPVVDESMFLGIFGVDAHAVMSGCTAACSAPSPAFTPLDRWVRLL